MADIGEVSDKGCDFDLGCDFSANFDDDFSGDFGRFFGCACAANSRVNFRGALPRSATARLP
ncbi:hypothetical protein ISG09_25520 [Burkholderia pseudomallei]|nr:hypothetical protein [Burkholderia pseudomallei]